MGKQGIFEYVNIQKQERKKPNGDSYFSYVLVSKNPNEVKAFYPTLKRLGFREIRDKRTGKSILFKYDREFSDKDWEAIKNFNAELEANGGQTDDIQVFISELEQLRAEIEAARIPLKTKTELELKLEDYIEKIANGVEDETADAILQQFIAFSSKFHDYSAKNIILIYLQKPDATRIAAKSVWNKMGRQVNVNAAITINCVNKYYKLPNGKSIEYKLEDQKKDREYLKKPAHLQSQEMLRQIRMRKNYTLGPFNACPVFDISDTHGADVPEEQKWTSTNDNNADANTLFDIAKKSLESIGIRVTQDPATAGETGWSRNGQINVSQDVTGSNAAATIFKEWASDLLYNTTNVTPETDFGQKAIKYLEDKGDLTNAEVKVIKAIQAEAIAAAVCKHYNLPAPSVTSKFKTLTQTSGGMSIKQIINENLSTLTGVGSYIVSQIEDYNNPNRSRQSNYE